jgi:FKBP-type peptidyl-prolyl cis-trans isomerase SlyD
VKIAKDAVVSLDVEVADLWGNVLARSGEPVHYLHGGYRGLLAAVEAALEGKQPGYRLTLKLEPEDAFGDYDEQLLWVADRDRFPEALEVGMRFEGIPGEPQQPDAGASAIYTVTDIAGGKVVLDGNHPLAGIAIKFSCTVRGVRPATPAERERGAADNPHAFDLRVAD